MHLAVAQAGFGPLLTPVELEAVRESSDPLVYQFVHALTDGPVQFQYPGPSVMQDFGGEAA